MTNGQGKLRDYLVDALRKDLVGPSRPDEELTDRPTIHYIAGILYPQGSHVSPEEDDEAAEAAPEDDIDPGTLMAAAFNPSAMGLTFSVAHAERLLVHVNVATYASEKEWGERAEGKTTPIDAGESETDHEEGEAHGGKSAGNSSNGVDEEVGKEGDEEGPLRERTIWKRREHIIPPFPLEIDGRTDARRKLIEGLEAHVRVRDRGDHMVVTVSLINSHRWLEAGIRFPDKLCFFQPQIRITSDPPGRPIFLSRRRDVAHITDPSRELNELLFRHAREFAVGHGCAATWNENGSNATEVRTEFTPEYEVLQLSPDWNAPLCAQSMKFLSEGDAHEIAGALHELVGNYRAWIRKQEALVDGLPPRMRSVALANLEACQEAANRMEDGISRLRSDRMVMEAFQLANRAMLMQRARHTWISTPQNERPADPQMSDEHHWRPFQLGFILLCLPSIVDPEHTNRGTVDLLWFPTGGGKTEAYLALTAFTIFLRRLRGKGESLSAGVTVLMRYTLRLLTLQQFQRAASLIMACEYIRRNHNRLGDEPIALGLWVGAGATPNRLEDARLAIEKLLHGEQVFEGNPYQILTCPWCGAELTPRDYHIGVTLKIDCPNQDCDFSNGFPLYLVDEDIYRKQPSLLIGTVDKFARLPWLAETSALFGRTEPRRLPPELIIQDELHLISGPLGTLVGLYETAIDTLCSAGSAPPKVIASTATIRRAEEHIAALFARDCRQFPPPGLDARDSFFSQQVPSNVRPSRKFVGVHAPGRSMKTALLRIYALLLQAVYGHRSDPHLRDPYWTVVGYFNSLRELGGAVRLVEDDVRARIQVLASRNGEKPREIGSPRELTSRAGSDEIPEILALAATPHMENGALDVLLATNMISVGVDIDRLGLMVVAGQPKMTAEYIQATSRIGRRYPGLVVTLYNWTRPRDRSHYERFVSYHSALYSHVEAGSVTPFSDRARDRGLHGVLVSIIRHLDPEMRREEAAGRFDPDAVTTHEAIEIIRERVRKVDATEADETLKQLEGIIRDWQRMTLKPELRYGPDYRNRDLPHLLEPAETALLGEVEGFPTLNSLRDVEGESAIYIVPDRRRNG